MPPPKKKTAKKKSPARKPVKKAVVKKKSPRKKAIKKAVKKIAKKKTAKKSPAKKKVVKKVAKKATKKVAPKAPPATKKSKKTEAPESKGRKAPPAIITSSSGGSGEISAVNLYYKNISQVELLSPKEEIDLAARIKKGDDKARDLMIRANLRLVIKIAHNYNYMGLSLPDLISEGNMGLMKAVERFDPKKGGKLSTYAAWWIKQSIKRALSNQAKTIRLPIYLVDKISKMRKAVSQFEEEFKREPANEEIAALMNISIRKVVILKAASKRTHSLNAPIQGDEGEKKEYSDIVGDENTPTPSERFEDKALIKDLHSIFDRIKPRDAEVIKMRFGVGYPEPMTLDEVGKHLEITRERVRQIQESAIRQIRTFMQEMESPLTAEAMQSLEEEKMKMQALQEFIESQAEAPENISDSKE